METRNCKKNITACVIRPSAAAPEPESPVWAGMRRHAPRLTAGSNTWQGLLLLAALGAGLLAGCAHTPAEMRATDTATASQPATGTRTDTKSKPRLELEHSLELAEAPPFAARSGSTGDDISPAEQVQTGKASYYGYDFAGQPTASGEPFDPSELTAAHKSLPFGTRVRVTNLANGEQVVVRINDRGPFVGSRIIDVSRRAAERLGMIEEGVIPVRLRVLD